MNHHQGADTRTVSIVIVDDDEVDVRAIQRGFQKQRISNPVFVARDGVDALELLRGEGPKPAPPRPYIILLDLNMPRMNGMQFLDELRADPELTDAIVFVLTTSEDEEDMWCAYRRHIAGYLVKSQAGQRFLQLVQMIEAFVITVQFPGGPIGRG